VDGSASNDASHMLGEARQAMLIARLGAGLAGASLSSEEGPPLMTARQALWLATRGGAQVLGRDDIGSLEPGKCADFFAVDLNRLDFAGALHDPLAALVFCAPVTADYTVVGGKYVVKEGRLLTLDLPVHIERHTRRAARLVGG
jgi:cytosine/adenosine deaminase-related metal-dependent hydrolase